MKTAIFANVVMILLFIVIAVAMVRAGWSNRWQFGIGMLAGVYCKALSDVFWEHRR